MFGGALDFNADLSAWDVSHVTDMSGMFLYASHLNSDLSGWRVSPGTNVAGGRACAVTCYQDFVGMMDGAGARAVAPIVALHFNLAAQPLCVLFSMAGVFLLVAGLAVQMAVTTRKQNTAESSEALYADLASA